MTHASGYPDYYPLDFVDRRMTKPIAPDDLIRRYAGGKLDFEPRARWSYSNTGMLVLGKVIEVVTKQDYFDYVREHVSKPAGMSRTDAYELDRVNENLAVGYEKEYDDDGTKRYRNNIFMHVTITDDGRGISGETVLVARHAVQRTGDVHRDGGRIRGAVDQT